MLSILIIENIVNSLYLFQLGSLTYNAKKTFPLLKAFPEVAKLITYK